MRGNKNYNLSGTPQQFQLLLGAFLFIQNHIDGFLSTLNYAFLDKKWLVWIYYLMFHTQLKFTVVLKRERYVS